MKIVPIILAGGSGTRLWPLSRSNYPKQFLPIGPMQATLLQATAKRVVHLDPAKTLILTNDNTFFLCQEQLESVPLNCQYLLEPCARNTAPAITAAALYVQQTLEDAILVILPSDHYIGNTAAFEQAIQQAIQTADNQNKIVTFGIKPNAPHTGYGYIEKGDTTLGENAFNIAAFHEKPESTLASEYLSRGNYYWNSGMFVTKASIFLQELEKYSNTIYFQAQKSVNNSLKGQNYIHFSEQDFSLCDNISIDYAVMEKTTESALIPTDMQWNDLGCWNSVADINPQDSDKNTLVGNVIAQKTTNCFIKSDERLVATLGLENHIVIATGDAILVANKNQTQDVKSLVQELSKTHVAQLQDHLRVARPWGYYEVLAEGEAFKVKRLMVKPGARLSLQRHQHRAEHWVVVSGTAEVVNDTQTLSLSTNESTYIAPTHMHRLSNKTTEPLYVIEVQSGSYLGEDDIERFDDDYQRL